MRCRGCTRKVHEDCPICGFCEVTAPRVLVESLWVAWRARRVSARPLWLASVAIRGWYVHHRRRPT
jgi:hypothetical protein